MRSEWEVLPLDEDGQPQSIFEEMPGAIPDAAEKLMRKEAEVELEGVKKEIAAGLDGDMVAKDLFGCLCDGAVKRGEIATKLGIDASAVSAGRKRLERKLEEFGEKHPGRLRLFIEEL